MGSHPINLTVRFLLELAALAALGYWGWTQHDGWERWLWAIGLPLITAVIWGTFAVPNDPSRSGEAPIPVPGIVRLIIELCIFSGAVLALVASDRIYAGAILAAITIIHYAVSYDRILWLLKN